LGHRGGRCAAKPARERAADAAQNKRSETGLDAFFEAAFLNGTTNPSAESTSNKGAEGAKGTGAGEAGAKKSKSKGEYHGILRCR
jgi:hypothetical protein